MNQTIELKYFSKNGQIKFLGSDFFKNNNQNLKIRVNDSIINNNYLKLDKGLSINAKIEFSKDIIDFSHMFEKCPLLEIRNWNLETSNAYDMCSMFNHCDLLNTIEPIKFWDTSKVEFMCHLFQGCKSLYIVSLYWPLD